MLFKETLVAVTLVSFNGCTGSTNQSCDKSVIYGENCAEIGGSCLFSTSAFKPGAAGIVCITNTCSEIPTTVPDVGCVFKCVTSLIKEFPSCSKDDKGIWTCMTASSSSANQYTCQNVSECSDITNIEGISPLYVSDNCELLVDDSIIPNEECLTPPVINPVFHQDRIVGLNCGSSGCLTHSQLSVAQLATSVPYLCDNWVKYGSVSSTWTNCQLVDQYSVIIRCRYDLSGLSKCEFMDNGSEMSTPLRYCQANAADTILRDCVQVTSGLLYGCTSQPNPGDLYTVNSCSRTRTQNVYSLSSIYGCYFDSQRAVVSCSLCSSMYLSGADATARVDVSNCISLINSDGYSCVTSIAAPSNTYTCSGSQTHCGTFQTCTKCTTTSLTTLAVQLRFGCSAFGSYAYDCSLTGDYLSSPFQCTQAFFTCDVYDGKMGSCTAQTNTYSLRLCTSIDPHGKTAADITAGCPISTSGSFTSYKCAISTIESTYRCALNPGTQVSCVESTAPTGTNPTCTTSPNPSNHYFCYTDPSSAAVVYAFCVQLTSPTRTTVTCATMPSDGSSTACTAGTNAYSCYQGIGGTTLYGCTPGSAR